MSVIALQIFVSFGLVALSLLLFAYSTRQRTHEHAKRLALLPLADDDAAAPKKPETQVQP